MHIFTGREKSDQQSSCFESKRLKYCKNKSALACFFSLHFIRSSQNIHFNTVRAKTRSHSVKLLCLMSKWNRLSCSALSWHHTYCVPAPWPLPVSLCSLNTWLRSLGAASPDCRGRASPWAITLRRGVAVALPCGRGPLGTTQVTELMARRKWWHNSERRETHHATLRLFGDQGLRSALSIHSGETETVNGVTFIAFGHRLDFLPVNKSCCLHCSSLS